jgi:hypothetical protein
MRALVGVLLVLAAVPAAANAASLEVETVSTRADMVSGGDVLVRVTGAVRPRVTVDGRDVSGVFRPAADGGVLGLVDGLSPGAHQLVARSGNDRAALELRAHPITGPVFSGPHETPFVCETEAAGLGPALDADCSVATRVRHFYRTTGGEFAPLPEGAKAYPAEMARTTTTQGRSVPYIVRKETGTVNRGIYEFALLDDPIAGSREGWNKRLIYNFGGGCTDGWYRQGPGTAGVMDDFMLGHGYAVASSSLNVFGNNCAEVLAAETMMMTRERFIEAYGPVAHTQGFGCSGGSYQQHQIADEYPGLLDGILPGCSFPEVTHATVSFITDAWLLDHYFTTTGTAWSAEQKRAVTGFLNYATAPNVAFGARRIDPRAFCGVVPVAQRYDPAGNPGGVRCDLYDHAVNVWGRDPATGFARRPLDNVGIQYGLKALESGAITPEQFVDLNERVGGFDADANIVAGRTVADPEAVRRAYRTGRVTYGGLGLKDIPIVDYRAYNDDAPNGDIHVRYHSFAMRERLRKANGSADNQVMLVEDQRYGLYGTNSPLLQHAILGLDRWITAIGADPRHRAAANKPAGLREGCNTRDANPSFVAEAQRRDPSTRCEQLYPSASFPREVAGGDVAADVVKCRLKPLDFADYRARFTGAQRARLRAAFPGGVCDWSRPGVSQQPPDGTWQRF